MRAGLPIICKKPATYVRSRTIKATNYYTEPWSRQRGEPRFMGLTALQFDIAVLVSIAGTALAIWLFVFSGTTTARDFIGLEKSPQVAVSQQPAPAAPAPEAAAAPPADVAPPADAAPPPVVAAAPVISPAQQMLFDSANALANDVQSFRGRFQVNMNIDGQQVNSGGDMTFQAPDKMHMTMNIGGQTFEMLALLPNMYIRIPTEGWYYLSGEALGFSPEVLGNYMNNRGLFDYDAQAAMLSGVTHAPDEYIDDVAYNHFQGTLDFQSLLGALPPDLLDPSTTAAVQAASGPVTIDILLDKTTNLPRRQTVSMELDVNGTSMSMDMRMAVTEYNGEVNIPGAPEDARPLESLRPATAPTD